MGNEVFQGQILTWHNPRRDGARVVGVIGIACRSNRELSRDRDGSLCVAAGPLGNFQAELCSGSISNLSCASALPGEGMVGREGEECSILL